MRPALEARLRAEAALDQVYDKANELEDILGSGATLNEAAAQIGVTISSLEPVDINGLTIDGTQPADDIASDSNLLSIGWELSEGEISVLAETGEATFFVVQLNAETDAAPRLLADVKDRAIADYKLAGVSLQQVAAETAMSDSNAFSNAQPATIKRSGVGLDHPAASLIASEAFNIAAEEMAVVETGDEAVLV